MRYFLRASSSLCAAVALVLSAAPWVEALEWLTPAWPGAIVLGVVVILAASARSVAAVGAVVALVSCGVFLTQLRTLPMVPDDPARRLVVVTHNVAVANVDPAATANALVGSNADVLLLQETDGRFAPMIARLRAAFPYSSPCTKRCSLAIFSRLPISRVRYRFRDANGAQYGPGLVQTHLRLPSGVQVALATLHLSHGKAPAVEAKRRANLAAAVVRSGQATGMILGGDFNLVPWSSRLRALDAALSPLQRVTHAVFSFPARIGGFATPPLAPIDHIYAGPFWRVAEVARLPRTGSDHFPVRAVLVWQGRGSYGRADTTGPVGDRGSSGGK